MSFPECPTDAAQVESSRYDAHLRGKNDLGSVHIHGPLGNLDSKVKIAYVIGMHPLESKSHRALFEKLTSKKDLKYCYCLYNINVCDSNSETEGRLEGQLLAQEFIRDDRYIANNVLQQREEERHHRDAVNRLHAESPS